MWQMSENNISMTVDDYGKALSIPINGITVAATDVVRLTIKNRNGGTEFFSKTFTNVTGGKINLVLSAEDTAKLPVGTHVYSLDCYKENEFMCNVIPSARFDVLAKA